MKIISTALIAFIFWACGTHAGIDSGGGSSTIGNLSNSSSIGSPFETSTTAIGDDIHRSGLIRVLYSTPADADSDHDGLTDDDELNLYGTDPLDADSDDDGLLDGEEVNTHGTDPLDADSDDDGLSDAAEVNTHGTDPLDADTDDDGLSDGLEINTYFSNPFDPDCDADGLLDGEEVSRGTGLFDADSDDDGLLDGVEVNASGTDPLDADCDDDGLLDGAEVDIYGTDPFDGDTDGDLLSDALEVANGGRPLVNDGWVIDHIGNHGSTFDLYPADSVLDLSIGQAGFVVSNGTAWLSLQLQESTDLNTWTNAGDEVIWSIPVDLDKAFYRVRSGH